MPFALSARIAHRRAAIALVGASALAGCALAPRAELLEVRELAPERVEPGHRLELRGAGFPPGRHARVTLEGRLHRPGEARREVEVDLEGHALASDRLEARFTERALEQLGGRGTFHGRVAVSFEAAGGGTVMGRSGRIVLDVTPPSTERLGDELARRRRASELATWLGLSLGEEDPDQSGLPVQVVADGSPAARSGLVAGDRLTSLEGVRLHSLSDFVPPPGIAVARLELGRVGEAATLELHVPIRSDDEGMSPALVRAAQAALAWLLVIALVLAPSASLLDWLSRRQRARVRATPSGRLRRHGPRVLRIMIGGAFLAALVAMDRARLLHVPLEAVLLGVLAALAVAAHLGGMSSESPWPRVAAIAAALGASVLAAIAVAVVGAAGGTTDLATLHDRQGLLPWEWTALRTPAGPPLAGLVLAAGAHHARGRALGQRVAAAVDETVALVLAALMTAVLFGGWAAPEGAGLATRLVAALLFVLKGLACWAAMRRAGRRSRAAWARAAAGAALAVAIAVAWMVLEPRPALETALAQALTAVAAVLLVALLVRRIADGDDPPPSPAHPFL